MRCRYANHSQRKNAYARVLLVDGDHRVGIFADRDMLAGTEIFYDYGYEDCHCPEWGEKGQDPNGVRGRLRKETQPMRRA